MNYVRKLRLEMKISQPVLARKANIGLRYLQKIESNQNVPTVYIAMRLAKILKKPIEEVFIPEDFFDT